MKAILLLATTAAIGIAARAGAGDGDNSEAIKNALAQLDIKNDNHWTADGQARIDTVKSLVPEGVSVTREVIDAASPGFNREKTNGSAPASPAAPPAPPSGDQGSDPMAAATADGWQPHPTAEGYMYKGQDVKANAEVQAMYNSDTGAQSAPSGGGQQAGEPSGQAQDISGQTGMGGAMTARSPEPVPGELRKTHVSEPSQGEPGETAIGITKGMTELGRNELGTPEGPVENPARALELSGEVAARNAGSVMTPSQASADSSSPAALSGTSLGGAADPLVEANAPGGAVIAEGAPEATTFEGSTVGGPFGSSGITASDGSNQSQTGDDFAGDPDTVAALEAELEQASQRTAELRGQVDSASAQLHEALRTEAQLRRQIEANRPRSGTMSTIQTFLRSSQDRRATAVREEREVRKALGTKAPK